MASKMGYYNVEEFVKQKRQQQSEIIAPPKANIMAAADHIRKLFEGKKFTYGIMGGLEMLCLGYRRELPDLQIAYDDRDFHKIKSKLEHDQRVRLPEGMNSLFPAKILVRTGPAYKDEGCTQSGDIEVDLIPPGSHGTPPNGTLASNLVLLSLKTEGKLKSYKGLNMLYLVKSLVHYCKVRDLARDPRKDILFLCQHYATQVQSIRLQLEQKEVQQNFLGTPLFSRLSSEDQRRCYQVLLSTEPPPTMAITPPPLLPSHKYSASASDALVKPRLSSYQSSPSLSAPTSSALLSPPLPSKPRAPRQHDVDGKTQILELPASSDAQNMPSELSTSARNSRSRYRQVGASHSREISPVDAFATAPNVMHIRQQSQPPPTSVNRHNMYQAQINLLQPPAQSNLATVIARGPRLVQNMNAGNNVTVPPYAFVQTPLLNHDGTVLQLQSYRSPVAISTAVSPGQPYMNSRTVLAGGPSHQQNLISNTPIDEHPIPPQVRTMYQAQQSVRADSSGISLEFGHTNGFYVVNQDDLKQDSLRSDSAIGVHPGVKLSPPVELDAVSQLGQFIAELSAERSTPAPDQGKHEFHSRSDTEVHQAPSTQQHNTVNQTPLLRESPVISPALEVTHTSYQAQHRLIPIRPLNPRTYSAPVASLPASLLPGGLPSHQRSPSSTHHVPTSNASKYARYYSSQTPPSSTPNSPQPAASVYKAYQPALSPLSPPILAAASPESSSTNQQSRFNALKDVDSANEDFKTIHHKRDASHDSQASSRSCDSRELAEEYRRELGGFEDGYGNT